VTHRPEDTEQSNRWRAARRQGLAYQGGVEAVFAMLIATGVGYWADQHFETLPRYLLIGMIFGFTAFVLRLLRLGRQLQERQSQEDQSNREEIPPRDDT
jgi:F0F1-type ATP synthase assembly protein I